MLYVNHYGFSVLLCGMFYVNVKIFFMWLTYKNFKRCYWKSINYFAERSCLNMHKITEYLI